MAIENEISEGANRRNFRIMRGRLLGSRLDVGGRSWHSQVFTQEVRKVGGHRKGPPLFDPKGGMRFRHGERAFSIRQAREDRGERTEEAAD